MDFLAKKTWTKDVQNNHRHNDTFDSPWCFLHQKNILFRFRHFKGPCRNTVDGWNPAFPSLIFLVKKNLWNLQWHPSKSIKSSKVGVVSFGFLLKHQTYPWLAAKTRGFDVTPFGCRLLEFAKSLRIGENPWTSGSGLKRRGFRQNGWYPTTMGFSRVFLLKMHHFGVFWGYIPPFKGKYPCYSSYPLGTTLVLNCA